jgi:hypothetical protein
MTTSTLKKFLVLYLVPTDVMAEWAKTDPATRNLAEEKMRAEWGRWMGVHAKTITLTEAAHLTIPQSSIQVMEVRAM